MDRALSLYQNQSDTFRRKLQQPITHTDNHDILYHITKHITRGPYIVDSLRQINSEGSSDSSSEGSQAEEEQDNEQDDEFDQASSREVPKSREEEFKRALADQGQDVIVWEDRSILVHDWLGQRSTQVIMSLQDTSPIQRIPGLTTDLWEYQRVGIAKIIKCWKEPYHSCILGDEMGLGKTIQAIAACLMDKELGQATFSLVVTTKSCVKQWAHQLQSHFDEDQCPSYFILDSNKITARQLIEGNFDFVICSYGFIQAQFRRVSKFQESFDNIDSGRRKKRQNFSLFSDLYRILKLPFRHLILDESQYVKNWETSSHRAIKALHYNKFLALTGTPIANKWWDIFGVIDFMKGHPFHTFIDFWRIFGNPDRPFADPPPPKMARLIKFLMELTVSRPASLMKLPGLTKTTANLSLNERDQDSVLVYTKLFLDALRRNRHNTNNAQLTTASSAKRAVRFATWAQQYAAHPLLRGEKPVHMKPHLNFIKEFKKNDMEDWEKIRNILTAMRKTTTKTQGAQSQEESDDDLDTSDLEYDPDLSSESDSDESSGVEDNEGLVEGRKAWLEKIGGIWYDDLRSNRINIIYGLCGSIQDKDSTARIVIFSKFLKFLDIINELLKGLDNISPLRLDGLCSKEQRRDTIDQFVRQPGSILLITPRTGGAGLNGLECASHLIQCEPWWTFAEEAQAYGRLLRPLQTKMVQVFYVFAENSTIDILIQEIRDSKQETNETIMGSLRRRDDEAPQIPAILELS